MTTNLDFENLFEQAVQHRNSHDCSAYPYEQYQKLIAIISGTKPQSILEIGTGMGFTATIMALASPQSSITTLEKDPEHVSVAKIFIEQNQVSDRVTVLEGRAEELLVTLNQAFDVIFFDGYQIHYEFLPHYQRLLKQGGTLVLGNNHLSSKTSDQFFKELQTNQEWKIIEQFADTTIAKKK